MIVNHEKKAVILGNPKTGTTTLEQLFDGGRVDPGMRHARWRFFKDNPDFKGYKFFGFWREPVDRFYSCCTYLSQIYHSNWERRNNPIAASEVEKGFSALNITNMDDITVDAILTRLESKKRGPVLDLFDHQVEWLNENVTILSYHHFDEDVRWLAERLGVKLPDEIPKLNVSDKQYRFPRLASEIKRVEKFYQPDYEFLGWQGVIQESRY